VAYQRKGCSRQTGELKQYVAEITNKGVIDRLPELYDARSEYTPEQKIQTAMVWLMTQDSQETSAVTGVNDATIRDWVTRSSWWQTACDLARKQLETKLDNRLDGLLRDALSGLDDRLKNGDDIVLKDGSVVKRSVGARDCAIISSILFEKRAALRGQPGNITERRDATAILDLIRNQAGKHGTAKLVEIDPLSVVSAPEFCSVPVDELQPSVERGADNKQEGISNPAPARHLNPENM
jgi:hypothetical protein